MSNNTQREGVGSQQNTPDVAPVATLHSEPGTPIEERILEIIDRNSGPYKHKNYGDGVFMTTYDLDNVIEKLASLFKNPQL